MVKTERAGNCILKAASTDIPVMGVCGGFQMLGMYISDEDGY